MHILESLERVFEPAVPHLTGADDVAKLFADYLGDCPQEVFVVLTLNAQNQPLALRAIHVGGIGSAPVDQRCIFRGAISDNACSIIVGHNHPSGNVDPSDADVAITNTLAKAGELLGVKLLDHLVIGTRQGFRYESLNRRGLIQ